MRTWFVGVPAVALVLGLFLVVRVLTNHTGLANHASLPQHTSQAKPGVRSNIVGNPDPGETVFVANCGTCHTLSAAGTNGNIGPNLDRLAATLTEATIIKQVEQGGSTLMGKAAANYTTQMVGYAGFLSATQIDDVAAFVYASTHH